MSCVPSGVTVNPADQGKEIQDLSPLIPRPGQRRQESGGMSRRWPGSRDSRCSPGSGRKWVLGEGRVPGVPLGGTDLYRQSGKGNKQVGSQESERDVKAST